MFEEFEEVRIKSSGCTGTIVDKKDIDGRNRYLVEDDKRNEKGYFSVYGVWEEDLEYKTPLLAV